MAFANWKIIALQVLVKSTTLVMWIKSCYAMPVMHGLSQQQHVVFCGMKWSGHFCHFSLLTASKQFLNFINALMATLNLL